MAITDLTRPVFRCACLWLVACGWLATWAAAAGPAPQMPSAPIDLPAAYWRQRIFFIPYQVNAQSPLADQVDRVRLLISPAPTGRWSTLEEAEPHVRGFSYHAPSDGEYWFAVQMVDRRGNAWPSGTLAPQLRIVVDTGQPQLELAAGAGADGRATLRYSATDAALAAATLKIEADSGNGWAPVPLPPPDVSQADRLMGRAAWEVAAGASDIRWRATISDRAGNRTTETIESSMAAVAQRSRRWELPNLPRDVASAGDSEPEGSASIGSASNSAGSSDPAGPSLEWPAEVESRRRGSPTPTASEGAPPPVENPYAALDDDREQGRVSAQLAASQPARSARPAVAPMAPPADHQTRPNDATWTSIGGAEPQRSGRLVNSSTFEVEYDLQAVGRWGVAKVALWGTRDGGQTWRSYAEDDDNRSPIRVTVPEGGTYGFRLLVDGANGAAAPPPQSGDPPELQVTVDLHKPSAELVAAEIGQRHLTDHLLISWSATDTNLEPRPIGLFYSTRSAGPWSPIATDLANTGQYAWRIERHVPDRFYLRLEVRDVADNVTAVTTPTPVALERPQPTGRLRDVRPVSRPSGGAEPPSLFDPPQRRQSADQTARAVPMRVRATPPADR